MLGLAASVAVLTALCVGVMVAGYMLSGLFELPRCAACAAPVPDGFGGWHNGPLCRRCCRKLNVAG